MGSIAYRDLQVHEAQLLGTIDRSESVDGIYRVVNGILDLDDTRLEVPSWSGLELAGYVARLQALIDSGGRVFAAWDERRLVGLGSLDVSGVGGDRAVMKLDMLYVSSEYRRRGIGRSLTEMAASLARSLGATALYISATPTRGTVDAYLHMGASLLGATDPELFAREPEDIHLALSLV
jgi:GNAT superfamily N-acetyltransferase